MGDHPSASLNYLYVIVLGLLMVRSRGSGSQLDRFGDFIGDKATQAIATAAYVGIIVIVLTMVIGYENAQRIGDALSFDPIIEAIGRIILVPGGIIFVVALFYLSFQKWKEYN